MKNVRAKKYLGQHFLNDEQIAFDITDLLSDGAKNVVEIGPGMGVLTQFLVKKDYKTEVVEIDRESVFYLRLNYPDLEIHEGDFLQLDLKEQYPYNFSLIGNFPYNISSQILFKAFENRDQMPEVVGMFQKEVAERIASKHNSKKYGILSVKTQLFYDVKIIFNVSPNVFFPKPKVDSAVISLTRKENINLNCDINLLDKVIKLSFQQRRKKIKNSLKRREIQDNILEDSIFELRPEQLSVQEFVKLTQKISNETI